MARKRPGRKPGGGGAGASGTGNQGAAAAASSSEAANANAAAAATSTAAAAAAPPPSTSSSSTAAAPKRQQTKPIPSSFEAARSMSSDRTGAAAAAAAAAVAPPPQQRSPQQQQQQQQQPRQTTSSPSSPRRVSSAARPGSGYEGTLSAGPSELAGYADGISGGGNDAGEEAEQAAAAAAADPERATATTPANGNASSPHSSHHSAAASVSTTIVTLLSLQLGWGLWLLPADFARLGWLGAGVTILVVASLTAYSASLFPRLVAAVEGAVLFGDVGEAAAGRKGRAAVYAIIYTLDASRCVVLHLAATQALQHAAGNPPHFAQWRFGLVVALLSLGLAQARNLAAMSRLLAAGTAAQLFAVSVVLATLLTKPDEKAPPTKLFESHGWVRTSVAVLNVFFAYGGQFAFTEVIVSMRHPSKFARAAGAATAVMTLAYSTLGAVGYASRGSRVHEIVIFALGEGKWERAAAGAVLLQALAQYLVNVNVWVHNLLVLLSRAREARRRGRSGGRSGGTEEPLLLPEGAAGGEEMLSPAPPRTATDHARAHWAPATLFVVSYSFAISMSLPFFSSLVGLLVAGTYLAAAYVLPCWFALKLLKPRGLLSQLETAWCRFLIGGSAVVSAVGLAASVSALVNNIGGGPAAA